MVERREEVDKGISPGLWRVARADSEIALRTDLHLVEDEEVRVERNLSLQRRPAHVCSECKMRATSGDHFESIPS